jgi:hypothetical protein
LNKSTARGVSGARDTVEGATAAEARGRKAEGEDGSLVAASIKIDSNCVRTSDEEEGRETDVVSDVFAFLYCNCFITNYSLPFVSISIASVYLNRYPIQRKPLLSQTQAWASGV